MGRRGPNAHVAKIDVDDADLSDLVPTWEREGLSRAERVIAFIESLKITAGMHAGRPFELRPWQRAIIQAVYATDAAGRRPVRQALITMGRKNGKTQLAAALCLAHLCGPEARPRSQCYSAAADREQAAIIYREMIAFLKASPALWRRVIYRDFKRELEDTKTGATYVALSSDARKAHGLSPAFFICDELAQWKARTLYDNLITGTGAHADPLGIVISTQSADPFHVMSELVHYGQQVNEGIVSDPTFAPFIYTVPRDADPFDEKLWRLANPALGDFRSVEEMRTTADQARRIPAREAVFRNLYLNQAIEPDERFIHGRDWDGLAEPFDPAELRGEECHAGLDLGSAADLCGLALWFPKRDRMLAWGFLPDHQMDVKALQDRAPYRLWVEQGHMIATPGRAIDKAWVAHKLKEIASEYDLRSVAYDRWGMKDLEVILSVMGLHLPLKPHGQGFRDMGASVEEFERLVLQERLRHGGNPLLRWCLSNAAVESDPAGNRKLAKNRSKGRIDPLIAAIMAVGVCARSEAAPTFEFTGMFVDV